MSGMTRSYWLLEKLIEGEKGPLEGSDESICVIGGGITGVASAYFLLKKGFKVTLVDEKPQEAASFRNASHVLYGTVENYQALNAFHGRKTAKELWALSMDVCHTIRDLVLEYGWDVGYRQDGYLVVAVDEVEDREIRSSIELLNQDGFQSEYVEQKEVEKLGFRNVQGARYEKGSAQIHPVKFRNALLKEALKMGLKYYSGVKVTDVEEEGGVCAVYLNGFKKPVHFMSAVIAANAYAPKLSRFFREKRLLEPFAGQIIVSRPMKKPLKISYPHSFNRGYEYAVATSDNRLLIGGWREGVKGHDIGNYDLTPHSHVDIGLKEFVKKHYAIEEELFWEFSWKGLMASSSTAFPFIGPTNSPLIFSCTGFTGHGLSWGCGSAQILAKIMAGEDVPDIVLRHFSPKK